jgi:CheY-like chemotaxis protein
MSSKFCGATLRVLVVDDHRDDLKMFSMWLDLMGCEVRTCSEARQCLEVAREFQPHLVFLDIAMPQMSGIDVAHCLHAANIPPFLLVARTGYADQKTKDECLTNGFNLVMTKPGQVDETKRPLETARAFATLHNTG